MVTTGNEEDVCSRASGTKCSGHYKLQVEAGQSVSVRCRLTHISKPSKKEVKINWADFSMEQQQEDADEFYRKVYTYNQIFFSKSNV